MYIPRVIEMRMSRITGIFVNSNGYLTLRLANGKLIPAHRYIWIVNNGKIPKGYDVDHIDKNINNNSLDNLRLLKSKVNQSLKKKKRNYIPMEIRSLRKQMKELFQGC